MTAEFRPMLIGGEWVEALDGERIEVESPADGTLIGSVPRGKDQDIERAVVAAATAFDSWRRTPPRDRGRLISAIAGDIDRETETIARETAQETGNAIRTQSRPETIGSADFFRYYGGIAGEFKGEVIPHGPSLLNYNAREPLGVIGGIVAWNSPLMLAATKITMAIATGNTVVIKAPEDAPIGILHIAAACDRHLPPGVVNVVTGYGEEAGRALVRHTGVAKISFTGSTEVGREIAEDHRQPHRAGALGTWRKIAGYRLSRLRHGRGGRRRDSRDEVYPSGSRVHRRIAPPAARVDIRLVPGAPRRHARTNGHRRSAR